MTITTTFGANNEPSAPWFCRTCQKWWVTVQWGVSCCVYHADGHCHYNDREVPKPEGESPVSGIEWGSFS